MKEKKVCFLIQEKRMVDFKVRLHHDGLTQSSFIGGLIEAYLNKDPCFFPVLENIKKQKSKISKKNISATTRKHYEGIKRLSDLSLSEEDKESIFDILEEIGEI